MGILEFAANSELSEDPTCRWAVEVHLLSRVRLFETAWTVAYQGPLSMGFSRQEYWSGLPFPSPGDLLNPRIKPVSPALQADSSPTELRGKPEVSSETSFRVRASREDRPNVGVTTGGGPLKG